ncbi:TPA: helix-turn-helix transcriptional regulator [Legionella pneumophila]|nr:helix-turn-helix transcriptional regulator [Legionella pneumophila]
MNLMLRKNVAKTIRKIRKQKQFSQEELAELANLDRTYISGVERNTRNITLDSLELIISALSISTEEFLSALAEQLKESK